MVPSASKYYQKYYVVKRGKFVLGPRRDKIAFLLRHKISLPLNY